MATRLVDVLDINGNVRHTFPITLDKSDLASDEAAYLVKALEAAANARLAPDDELHELTARIHVSRGGQLEPYGDGLNSDSETKAGLEQLVREQAYLLWEQNGCPEGKADEFWHRALDQHFRERAYVLWQQEGRPEGNADKDWDQIRVFQNG
ncbi:DUF2934 domain-containing protein [Noviherbaspirillum sp.]|uniref:DUF2934 domain-containing protein n=1 Tax=Noviherbaspirillum sp. TaxID=1926288 RepID=UPI002FDF626F